MEGKPLTIVACLDVFMEKMIPFEEFKEHCLTIDFESIIDTDALKLKLSELGYENSGLVEAPGQFGIRGGIIDIFPLTEELPVRIELWGMKWIPSALLIRKRSEVWKSWTRFRYTLRQK